MAIIRDVVLYPDEPLTAVAEPITTFGPELEALVADMFETMYAHEGVGLAGPQIGVAQRIFVMREPDGPEMALINPEIANADGREVGEEGCLSLPQVYADVPRAERIQVKAFDPQGNPIEFDAEGLLARIVQHELDHLNGVIFLDRTDILTRQAKLSEWDDVRRRIESGAAR